MSCSLLNLFYASLIIRPAKEPRREHAQLCHLYSAPLFCRDFKNQVFQVTQFGIRAIFPSDLYCLQHPMTSKDHECTWSCFSRVQLL